MRPPNALAAATHGINANYRRAMDTMRKNEFSDDVWESMDAKTKAEARSRYSDAILHGGGQPQPAVAEPQAAPPVASVRDRAIAAARSGDATAQKALEERGIQWREF